MGTMKVFVALSVLATVCLAQLPVPGSIPSLSIDQQYQYILQLQRHLNQQVQWNGRKKRSCQFLELQDWFLDLLLRHNGTNSNWLKLLFLTEERREVFQFQEQLVLFRDQQLK